MKRKVVQIAEVVKSKEYQLEDIMILSQDPGDPGLRFTGYRPWVYERLKNKVNYFRKELEETV